MKTGDGKESPSSRESTPLQTPGAVSDFLAIAFDAVVTFNARERVTSWNPAAEQMYGWTAQEALGKTPAKLFWPVNTPQEQKERRQRRARLKRGEILQDKQNVFRKDGSSLCVQSVERTLLDADQKFSGSLAIYRAIPTQESGRKFSSLFDKANFAAALSQPPDGVFVDVNEAWVEMFGYSRQEVIGKTALELNINPDANGRTQLFARLQETGFAHGIEMALQAKSVEWRNFLMNLDVVEIDGQKYILTTIQDITERKRAEAQLERSNQKLDKILASIQDDFFVIDRNWNFVYANRQFTSKLGKEPGDLIGNNVWKLFPKHIGTNFEENLRAAMEKRETRRFEISGKYTEAWYKLNAFPSPEGITVLGTDVTESKRAEEEIQASQQILETVVKYMPASVALIRGSDLHLQLINPAYQAIAPGKEMVGHTLDEVWPETGQNFTAICRRVLETGEPYEVVDELSMIRRQPDGPLEPAYFSWSLYRVRLPGDEGWGLLNTSFETTARKQAEKTLHESEERLRQMIETSPIAIGFGDSTGKIFGANMSFYRLTGYSREEIEASQMGWNQLTAPEYAEIDRQIMAMLAAHGSAGPYEKEYIRKDGSRVPLLLTVSKLPGRDEHIAFIMDITARKQAEQAVRESQRKYQDLIETTSDFIWEMDSQSRYTYCSPQMEKLWGIKPEDMIGKTPFDVMPPQDREGALEYFQEVIRSASPFSGLTTIAVNSQGNLFYVETSGVPFFDHNGNLLGFRGITRDITERNRTRQQIFESNQRLMALMNALPVGVSFSDDPTSQHVTGNPTVLTQFEVSSEDNLSASAPDSSAPGRQVKFFRNGRQITDADLPLQRAVAENREIPAMEFEVHLPSGRRWWASGSGAPIHDQDGNVIGGVAVTQDITVRKRGEEQLRELSQRLTYHVDNSPLAVIEWGSDMRLVRWSGAAEQMFGWKAEEVLGKRMEDLHWIYEEDTSQVSDVSTELQTGANPQRFSANRNYRKDGSVAYCEWYNSSLLDESGRLRSILSLVLDVTERKRAEDGLREHQTQLQLLNETLEQKVHEKTAEVHRLASDVIKAVQQERHRISHILHDDLQQRIYAIQMQLTFLHDELEQETARQEAYGIEKQLAEILEVTRHLSIDLSPPILRGEGLTQAIHWLATQMQQRYGLPIETQAEGPFALDDEELHVLVFNCVRELLFNVVKHAQASRAVVTLQWLKSGLQIEVRDDGRGFPVNMLVRQANGGLGEEDVLPTSSGIPTIHHQLSLFGGRMEIRSEPGAGTQIVLIVPAAQGGE